MNIRDMRTDELPLSSPCSDYYAYTNSAHLIVCSQPQKPGPVAWGYVKQVGQRHSEVQQVVGALGTT